MQLYSLNEMTPESAYTQIQFLSNFEEGVFRPTTCDTAEPLREKFNPADISEQIRWISQAGAWFQFRKSKPYRIEGWIRNQHFPKIWTQEHKGGPLMPVVPVAPEPTFLTTWTVWFDVKAMRILGADLLRRFFFEAAQLVCAEYGYFATEEDLKAKNFYVLKKESNTIKGEFITFEKSVGEDPALGIPGLYWVNFFGSLYSSWFDFRSHKLPAEVIYHGDGSTLIQFSASPQDSRSEEVLQRQLAAIATLGRNRFCDVDAPNKDIDSPFTS